jgi:hypothetical protein
MMKHKNDEREKGLRKKVFVNEFLGFLLLNFSANFVKKEKIHFLAFVAQVKFTHQSLITQTEVFSEFNTL